MELTTGDIQAAYDRAREVYEPLLSLREAGEAMYASPEKPNRTPELLNVLDGALTVMRDPVESLHAALRPILETLHICSRGRVDMQGSLATSYIAAFAGYMDKKIELAERLLAGNDGGTTLPRNLSNVGSWTPAKLDVEFDLECARVKDHLRQRGGSVVPTEDGMWSVSDGLVRLEGDLRKLTGQSRRIMQHMIRRYGQAVTYTELAEHVWGDDYAANNTIQQGFRKLRGDLKKAGVETLADRIQSVGGSYRLL